MSIQYAILGLLSWHPASGYELKKFFAQSPFFHWSGNSNQIYTTLLKLHEEGYVSSRVQHQEKNPTRKIYHVTPSGLERLQQWLCSSADFPEYRNPFLTQLAWADRLNDEQLGSLLGKYEEEVQSQWLMAKEQTSRGLFNPARTEREKLLWDMMNENRLGFYHNELTWIKKLRKKLSEVQ